ncbi:MAG: alpha/beta hydrolase fold domain-containing protein [Sphingobium sp.]
MSARTLAMLAVAVGALASNMGMAQQADTRPQTAEPPSVRIDEKGTVHIPEVKVPLSPYMSEAARKSFIESVGGPANPAWSTVDAPIELLRKLSEGPALMGVDYARKEFPVDIQEQVIGGVPTRVITPKKGVAHANRNRVLIELHGGGFFTGADGQAQLDAIPVAVVGGYKVVAVKYRQGPEYRFPAATEDVAAVYRALLKQYKPANIGIYGCSTGGSLTAMAVAWFQKEHLPRPGAIGIFSGGAYAGFENLPDSPGAWGGDSRYTAPPLVGEPLWPIDPTKVSLPAATEAYLKGADLTSPLASPAMHPDVLAKFPPTLVLSGTRSFGMSAAVQTHRELVKAGADAELHLWDGQGHCFYYDFSLPESKEAFATISGFFDKKLGR